MAAPVRSLILDAEAVSALLSTAPSDPKRATVLEAILAANGSCLVPTAVRCEAWWRRADPQAANANRLVPSDDVLDRPGADRDVELRRAVPTASLVDAAVMMAAERAPAADVIEVLTSDLDDLSRLAGAVERRVDVRRI